MASSGNGAAAAAAAAAAAQRGRHVRGGSALAHLGTSVPSMLTAPPRTDTIHDDDDDDDDDDNDDDDAGGRASDKRPLNSRSSNGSKSRVARPSPLSSSASASAASASAANPKQHGMSGWAGATTTAAANASGHSSGAAAEPNGANGANGDDGAADSAADSAGWPHDSDRRRRRRHVNEQQSTATTATTTITTTVQRRHPQSSSSSTAIATAEPSDSRTNTNTSSTRMMNGRVAGSVYEVMHTTNHHKDGNDDDDDDDMQDDNAAIASEQPLLQTTTTPAGSPSNPANLTAASEPTSPPPSKLNMTIMIAIFIALFANSVTMTMLFPFVGFMVRDWHIVSDEKELGYIVGLIASSLFVGRAVGSYPWGVVADRWGRKPVILISMLALAVNTALFGASSNLTWALLTRFATGAFSGLVPAAKAVAGEISDVHTQGAAMSIISIAWSGGMVMGPAIGGLLTHPAEKWPELVSPDSILAKYPAFLPCIVSSIISTVGLIAVAIFLPETLKRKAKVSSSSAASESNSMAMMTLRRKKRTGAKYHRLEDASETDGSDSEDKRVARAHANSDDDDDDEEEDVAVFESTSPSNKKPSSHPPKPIVDPISNRRCCGLLKRSNKPDSELIAMLKDPDVMLLNACYGLYGFAGIVFDEVSALWFIAPIKAGGLEYDSSTIGGLLLVIGLAMLICSLFLFPVLERRFGTLYTFEFMCLVTVVLVPLFPSLAYLVNQPGLLFVSLVVVGVAIRVSMSVAFSAINVAINNSVYRHQRGTVNGLAMSLNAMTRALGPACGGALFAFSLTFDRFPINASLVFIIIGICFGLSVWLCAMVSTSLNKPKDESVLDRQTAAEQDSEP
ncbi:hypothetical protein CAOG_02001 [Capsaspora owczarzaki ATCC 30864]|uniref:Major facilitator superfamily (MFS) profile domain-containing protein n=1 Tax=Capsaspora owczarzaki (strain ATCC 30864) TaxID=595528 RepID=A0A0D2WLJ1_CAPO3|nr:hypothetical protein CAOG_02001 [Capsaspora owczarzaki ATCC 30864]KJE90743.1 hypothetical protein CAOG_002001 [Capsaspora owczarzaki ATCC 30864]|eukprot:XP_004364869.1 hypothetical protein CAOG_02001 [Capsaspora owczarzaki ATCC 30864]